MPYNPENLPNHSTNEAAWETLQFGLWQCETIFPTRTLSCLRYVRIIFSHCLNSRSLAATDEIPVGLFSSCY